MKKKTSPLRSLPTAQLFELTTHPQNCLSGVKLSQRRNASVVDNIDTTDHIDLTVSVSAEDVPRCGFLCNVSFQPQLNLYCPPLPACQQQHAHSGQVRELKHVKPLVPRLSVLNEPYAAFKRDGIAMQHVPPFSDKSLLRQELELLYRSSS